MTNGDVLSQNRTARLLPVAQERLIVMFPKSLLISPILYAGAKFYFIYKWLLVSRVSRLHTTPHGKTHIPRGQTICMVRRTYRRNNTLASVTIRFAFGLDCHFSSATDESNVSHNENVPQTSTHEPNYKYRMHTPDIYSPCCVCVAQLSVKLKSPQFCVALLIADLKHANATIMDI